MGVRLIMEWYNFDFLSEHCYVICFDQLLMFLFFYHLMPVQNQVVEDVWSAVHKTVVISPLHHETDDSETHILQSHERVMPPLSYLILSSKHELT